MGKKDRCRNGGADARSQFFHSQSDYAVARIREIFSRKDAKQAKKEIYLFFRTLAAFAPLREILFSDFFLNSEFQRPRLGFHQQSASRGKFDLVISSVVTVAHEKNLR